MEMADGLEALSFAKSNKRFSTYNLMQKVWNKVRELQQVEGFTRFSPIWGNRRYLELERLQYGTKWQKYGIIHMTQIFRDGKLRSFSALQAEFNLPASIRFYHFQLQHAVRAQSNGDAWILPLSLTT